MPYIEGVLHEEQERLLNERKDYVDKLNATTDSKERLHIQKIISNIDIDLGIIDKALK